MFDRFLFSLLISMRALFVFLAVLTLGISYGYAIAADLNQSGLFLFFSGFTGIISLLLTPVIKQERSYLNA